MMNSLVRFGQALFLFLVIVASSINSFSLVTHTREGYHKFSSQLHVSSSLSSDDNTNESLHSHHNVRRIEFLGLEPTEESSERRQRIKREQEDKERFITYGDELWNLRASMDELSHGLHNAINHGEKVIEEDIRQELRKIENQDPDLVYEIELRKLQESMLEGREEDAKQHSMIASAARSCLPQYNLDGLWVGKYGHNGYEMINVTYQGDLLIAYKVTGDKNVPRGEITFQADLNPLRRNNFSNNDPSNTGEKLQPINLTEKAAKKWGTTQLPRHKGLGKVAEPGFQNHQWMEGQLIIIGEEYFSFAWVPIEQQIFFGRPSPELALKMLREIGEAETTWEEPPTLDSDTKVLKDYISSCLEKTAEVEEEDLSGDAFSCIWTGGETEECYFQ